MEYLLVMSLSGSTMAVMYLLMGRLLWEKFSARTLYLLARVAILYYLIPLPFLEYWYGEAIRVFLQKNHMEAARISLTWTNYAVHADQRLYVNIYAIIQIALAVVWLAGACFQIGRKVPEYVRTTRFATDYAEEKMTDRNKEIIAGMKGQYGVRRRVAFYYGGAGERTMTIGVIKPVIICGREPESREAELLIRHEMVHIKRLDVFWEILLEFTFCLHWWNPVMRKLYHDFERVCECSCDETAMQGKSGEEVRAYLRLLIEEAKEQKETEDASPRWKSGFGDSAEKIKERMENLMKKGKWNRFAVGVLVAALTFANSMTVFAYRDVVQVEVADDSSQKEIDYTKDGDTYVFTSDGTDEKVVQELELLKKLEIRYDHQFIDEEGNIYPVYEDGSIEPYCNHEFVSGTSEIHKKYSDGSCEVREYRSKRCVKCGYIVQGDLIATQIYVTCPH